MILSNRLNMRRWFAGMIFIGFIAGASGEVLGNGVDLSQRDLSHANYVGRDLRGANLRDADLTSAYFAGADLRGADFTGTKLKGVDFKNADLRETVGWETADFGSGIVAQGADFSNADLRGATVAGIYFENANFSGADLTGATLAGRFHGAKFDGAIVADALLVGAEGIDELLNDLRNRGALVSGDDVAAAFHAGRSFRGTHLYGARLQNIDLVGIDLENTNLQSARCNGARLERANLHGVRLPYGTAHGATFRSANLSKSELSGLKAVGANFEGASLAGASLWNADVTGANFRGADLTGANLTYANLTGADFTGAVLKDVIVRATILDGVRGVEPDELRQLQAKSARWRHDLSNTVNAFLKAYSLPLHFLFAALTGALCVYGLGTGSVRWGFGFLLIANLAVLFPVALSLWFALNRDSPGMHMASGPGLWLWWVGVRPSLMASLFFMGIGALIGGGAFIVRAAVLAPRKALLFSSACALLTLLNCVFAFFALSAMTPTC